MTSSQKNTTQAPSTSSQNQSTPSTSTTALKDASTLVVKNVKINLGDSFSNVQAFVSATDQNGAALALSHLRVSGTVDPTKAGSYTLTFTNEKLVKTALVTVSDPTAVPDVEYSTQIQNIGWDSVSKNGALSGTSGKSLRMEAIKINLSHLPDGLT
ncbi:MAG: bacterial Ig-like domain-containing protein, partial [Lactococcus hircilactis]